MEHTNLTKVIVRNRLDYGTYQAAQAQDAQGRRLFRSHEIMHKIYATTDGTEILHWYQCTRCQTLIYCVPRNGTKPLNAHAEYKCTALTDAQEEAGRLAFSTQNRRNQNPQPILPQIASPNSPEIPAINNAPANPTATATETTTTTTTTNATTSANPAQRNEPVDSSNEVVSQPAQPQLTADELAVALWTATRLGANYGVVPATTFRRFLSDDEPWVMSQIMDSVQERISAPFQPVVRLQRAPNPNVAVVTPQPGRHNQERANAGRQPNERSETNVGEPTARQMRASRRNLNR